jgi:predicted glycogen debranching enzyme
MTTPSEQSGLAPLVVPCRGRKLEELLEIEWLRGNRLGAYAASTVVGCHTRRYHGLLIAATTPPVGRVLAVATVMEQVFVNGRTFELAANEFADAFSPNGAAFLDEFRDDVAATFVYSCDGVRLIKRVLLAEDANAVTVRYELSGAPAGATLRFRPFTPLRDYHALCSADGSQRVKLESLDDGVRVRSDLLPDIPLTLRSPYAAFEADPQWWFALHYRQDASRGQGCREDLWSPGLFVWTSGESGVCEITAALGQAPFDLPDEPFSALAKRGERRETLAATMPGDDEPARRLAAASDVFIVRRATSNDEKGKSILAGFPWFADWGRDAFIALPGLLLTTGRFEDAKAVFRTFANVRQEENADGRKGRCKKIPNRFDEYDARPHFNSVDASLWFIVAAERFLASGGDAGFWRGELCGVCEDILAGYRAGGAFGIGVAADGLLLAGDASTQLTWMDAKVGSEPVTPRWGKAVEINALWHSAHAILADRGEGENARRLTAQADEIAEAFRAAFWNSEYGWLNDVVNDQGEDASLRPNQILAVSLPHSPLSEQQQRRVVEVVRDDLLTPMGLRTLSPHDPRYRGRYEGPCENRDRAYHQGTVWAWLIGPFIEAYLKVECGAGGTGRKKHRVAQRARAWLKGLDDHVGGACLGSIGEIFDGDPPHRPRGCFAQAWSVGEVLRAKALIAECET